MKKIFITGGAGYVGAMLVPHLLEKGYEVTVYDLMIYGSEVLEPNKKLNIIKGDLRDIKKIKESVQNHEVVIHLACISNDPSFELNPKLGKSINLDPFEPFVRDCIDSGVERFIYASSSSVYGIKKEKNVSEDMSLEPLTDYSKFKVQCEKILLSFKNKNFTPIVIRPATVCGYSPRQRLDVVVNILTNLAYHKRKISIFGGDQLRPNIHIKDMVQAYDLLIEADKEIVSHQIFNAGYENQSVSDLGESVKEIVGEDVILEKQKTDDNRSYHISSEKIKKVLNFSPKFTIRNAIEDLKKAFEDNKLPNSLTDEKYFNIKRMNSIKLK
jgi:nucleoside-diphosphate-sugar epimerase